MNWILTQTAGKRFDLFESDTDIIDSRDIAHSLAHLCRFSGYTLEFYSVAQHSCLVADLVPVEHKLALVHDATEAYIGDMVRPLKQWMHAYQDVEAWIWERICTRLGIDQDLPASVSQADLIALATERRDLMPNHPTEWECLRNVPSMPETIIPQSAPEAYMQYFSRLMELMQGNHRRACA